MFRNEEQKMSLYKQNLKKEATNQFNQGLKLQEYLDYQKGIDTQESGINRFAEAIGQQIGDSVKLVPTVNSLKTMGASTESKTLSSLNKMKTVQLADPSAVYSVDNSGVSIKRKSAKQPKSIAQPPKPKAMKSINIPAENALMGAEDTNMNTLTNALNTSKATEADLKSQAEKQAELDLLSLFQQDVKEGRKRQAMKAIADLTPAEDQRIRQVFMGVLDDMMDEINLKASRARSKKQFEEQKLLIDKIQTLIEKQRMEDVFQEFSKLAIRDEFASKIQRNLKILLNEKRANRAINEQKAQRGLVASNRSKVQQELINRLNEREIGNTMNDLLDRIDENINRRIANKQMSEEDKLSQVMENTIKQRMAELRARKAEKKRSMSNSSDTTSIMSDAPKIDMRRYNKGATPKDTNKELEIFTNLLIQFDQSSGQERKSINTKIRDLIKRQEKTNPKIALRMSELKSALNRQKS